MGPRTVIATRPERRDGSRTGAANVEPARKFGFFRMVRRAISRPQNDLDQRGGMAKL
jgi:hypothetical protein